MAERAASLGAAAGEVLPAELERRIHALERAPEAARDFDAFGWAWMMLLGVALPVLLLIIGWWFAA